MWAASWVICKVRTQRPEGHPYLRLTRMLEPGVVVTVEPGIYSSTHCWRPRMADQRARISTGMLVAELKPYGGIRIEDNVVATPPSRRT